MGSYDISTLRDLLVRVEAATGPDRELDADILSALGCTIEWKQANYTMKQYPVVHWDGTREPCPQLTASIDAAVALIERVLPHSLISLSIDHTEGWTARVRLSYGERMLTPALALFSALLKALIAREDGRGQPL